MHFLALECSSSRRSVAVASQDGVLARTCCEQGRTTPLLALVENVLSSSGLDRQDVARLHVGLGPGSYTGIRSALALAQGWSLALDTPLVGQSSANACAWAASGQGVTGNVAVVIDAQRGEFYVAAFDLTAPRELRRRSSLRLASRAEVQAFSDDRYHLIGPDLAASGLVGTSVFPDAGDLLEMVLSGFDEPSPAPLEPIYLRPTSFQKSPPAREIAPL